MRLLESQPKVSNSNKIPTDLVQITKTSLLNREISQFHTSRFINLIKVIKTLQTKIIMPNIVREIVIQHCQIF